LRATRGGAFAWAALAGLPLAVAFGWRLSAPPLRAADGVEPSARTAARACIAGAAIALAARTGSDAMSFRAMTNAGAAMATLGALVALARLAGFGGLAPSAAAARRLDAVPFASLLWTVAIVLPLA